MRHVNVFCCNGMQGLNESNVLRSYGVVYFFLNQTRMSVHGASPPGAHVWKELDRGHSFAMSVESTSRLGR